MNSQIFRHDIRYECVKTVRLALKRPFKIQPDSSYCHTDQVEWHYLEWGLGLSLGGNLEE